MPEIYFAQAALMVEGNAEYYKKATEDKEPYTANIVNAVIRDKETGENVTANYDITKATVKVEILKRQITVGAKALTVGQDFYLEDVSSDFLLGQLQIISGSLAEGDSFSGTALKAKESNDTYTITGYELDKDNYYFNKEATGLLSVISGNTDA